MARLAPARVVAWTVVALVALTSAGPAWASREDVPAHMLATIRRHDPQLRRCYTRVLRAEPSVRGKLVVRFQVGATGQTRAVRFATTATTLQHPRIEECVARVFRAMRFRRLAAPAWFSTPLVFSA